MLQSPCVLEQYNSFQHIMHFSTVYTPAGPIFHLGNVTSRAERVDAHAIHYGQWYSSELINHHMIPLSPQTSLVIMYSRNVLKSTFRY